nr:unnamed protein product [Digitaria exilis]
MSAPRSGTHPGRRRRSGRSRYSQVVVASSSGRWSIRESSMRLEREAEAGGERERLRAEHVGQERHDVGVVVVDELGEEGAEVGEASCDGGEHAGLDAGVGGEVVEGDGGEGGRGDGGREGGEDGGVELRGEGEGGVGDDGGGEAVVLGEALCEDDHREDVTGAGAGEQDDMRRFGGGHGWLAAWWLSLSCDLIQ